MGLGGGQQPLTLWRSMYNIMSLKRYDVTIYPLACRDALVMREVRDTTRIGPRAVPRDTHDRKRALPNPLRVTLRIALGCGTRGA